MASQATTPGPTLGSSVLSRRRLLTEVGALGIGAGLIGPAFLSACSNQSQGDAPAGSAFGRITSWSQGYGANPSKWTTFTKSLTQQFKGVDKGEVNWVIVPWASALQKWNLAMSNCTNPDVGDMFFLQSRVQQGSKKKCGPLDITAEVNAGTFGDWNRFVPVARNESSFQEKIYGIPWRIDIRTLVYNAKLWTPVTTLEEFENQAVEIVGTKNLIAAAQVGVGIPYQALKQIAALWDLEFLTADLKRSTLDDDRWMEICLWTQDMISKKVFLRTGVTDTKGNAYEPFLKQQVALTFTGQPGLREQAKASAPQMADLVSAQLMPVGASGKVTGLASSAQFSIFENSKYRDTAIEWLKYITAPGVAAKMVQEAGTQSSDTKVQAASKDKFIAPFYEISKTALGIDQPSIKWTQLTAVPEGPFSKLAFDIFTGKEPKVALLSAHEAATKILAS